MKKSMIALLVVTGMLSASWAQTTIINTGFRTTDVPAYNDGDLAGQNNWTQVANTGANAFEIIDANGSGFADTIASDGVDTNEGDYVYLNTSSPGNYVDDEFAGVMDFTLTVSSNTFDDANGDVWRMGISSVVNTNMDNIDTNNVYMRIATLNGNGNIVFRAPTASGGGATMLEIDAASAGWNGTNDLSTDMLRLSWTMRKARASLDGGGYYSFNCSVSNLVTGTNMTGVGVSVEKSLIYADIAPYTVMGIHSSATYADDIEMVDITIDDLSYTKTASVGPTLYPTPVSVESGNTLVDLSWDHVAEAQTYDVTQIHGAATNVVAPGITTNGYQDTGLVNGDEYIYIVTSKATGASDADSAPVSGFPDAAVTGTFLDTTFAATDSPPYADGDLAGQNNWKEIHWGDAVNGGINAFNVDSSANGFAETKTFEPSFSTNDGNAVYYNKFTSNEVNMAWSGTMVFSLNTDPFPGLYATNIYDVISGGTTNIAGGTNIQQVADLPANRIFNFGITDDPADNFESYNGGDALITVRTQGDGDIEIGFNQNGAGDPEILITRGDLEWDPEWRDDSSNNAPDFLTEPITLNWKIRKTWVTNTYVLVMDVAVGTNTFDTTPIYIPGDQGVDSLPDLVWPADSAYFGMHHDQNASGGGADESLVHVSVDSVSVTHTNNGFEAFVPHTLVAENGNLTIDVLWTGSVEAVSYDVYISDGISPTAGPWSIINVTAPAYTDTGLTDLRTYFYKVVANYPGAIASAETDVLMVRALGQDDLTELHWGPGTDIVSSEDPPFTRTVDSTNGVIFSEGNGTDGALMHTSRGDYNENVSLYGVMQVDTNSGWGFTGIDHRSNEDSIHLQQLNNDGTNQYAGVIYMKPSAPLNFVATNHNMTIVTVTGGYRIRAAIRNSGTWYISDHDFSGTGSGNDLLTSLGSAEWAEIQIATSSMTNLMSIPEGSNFVVRTDLNNIDAIGYFVLDDTGQHRVGEIAVTVGTTLDDYNLWTDSVSLYNDNAARTNDVDDDGLNNVWEWGMGGDPFDSGDIGYGSSTNIIVGYQAGPTNYIVYVHPRKKNPRPDTFLVETADLILPPGYERHTSNYVINTMGNFQGDSDFQTVTNLIPTTDPQKFIKLNIE